MPRYFFNVRIPDEADREDSAGTVYHHDIDALDYAYRVIQELKHGGDYGAPGIMMIVKDHTGRIVFSIPF